MTSESRARGRGLRQVIADRPWLLIVIGMALLLGMTVSFVIIAALNPPVVLPPAGATR